MQKIRHELNYLTKEDGKSVVTFLASLLPALIMKLYYLIKKKRIWLISEDRNEARDNGICFFRYVCMQDDAPDVYYAISRSSTDHHTVSAIGKTVAYGSIRHWILYLNAQFNISTQKAGRPGAAIGYVLEHLGIIKGKSIFLQHGITINKAKWLFYENTKMRLFICGAKPEYDYVLKEFGYPKENVAYLGFCRFDDYHEAHDIKRQILLIPSWREWIGSKNEFTGVYEDTSNFENTEYYQRYQSLINNKMLHEILDNNDVQLFFYPHRNMQQFVNSFSSGSKNVTIVNNRNSNIRQLLIQSALMITDYSSVALDFAYMLKPVIYYQFDENRFREAQYEKGYFDYKTCGLGEWADNEEDVIRMVEKSIQSNFVVDEIFQNSHRAFFPLYDSNNCERIYRKLRIMGNE